MSAESTCPETALLHLVPPTLWASTEKWLQDPWPGRLRATSLVSAVVGAATAALCLVSHCPPVWRLPRLRLPIQFLSGFKA